MMNAVVVFDADNTLWDTNTVFREAQISLLNVFAEAGLLKNPADELDTLRAIDRALIRVTGQFEYDFASLAVAVGHYYSRNSSVDQAVKDALAQIESVSASVIEKSCTAFARTLETIPPLFNDTEQVLHLLISSRALEQSIVLILFTDGERARIERILQAYGLGEQTFDEVVIGRKTVKAFEMVRELGLKKLESAKGAEVLMIGDSLKRDIGPSKQAGFTTIYKPGDFLGSETPSTNYESPDFRIKSLRDLPDVFERIGMVLHQNAFEDTIKAAAAMADRS